MLYALWDKLKAACFRSLTVAWSYVLGIASAALIRIDDLAALLGDAAFTSQVQAVVGADPKVIGRYLSLAALITIASRMRGVIAGRKATP
jgi:hypothetical protein